MTTRILLKNSAIFKGDIIPSSPGLWSAFLIMGALNYLIPVSAILLGVVVLGERLAWNAFAGMGLIFIGLIAIDGRLLKMFKRKEDVAVIHHLAIFQIALEIQKSIYSAGI
jgi:hypothetical protein